MNENPFASPEFEELPAAYRDPTRVRSGGFEHTFYNDASMFWRAKIVTYLKIIATLIVSFPVTILVIALIEEGEVPPLLVFLISNLIMFVFTAPFLVIGLIKSHFIYKKMLRAPSMILFEDSVSFPMQHYFWSTVHTIKRYDKTIIFNHNDKSRSHFNCEFLRDFGTEDVVASIEHYSGISVQ